jgi:hypothetical protein
MNKGGVSFAGLRGEGRETAEAPGRTRRTRAEVDSILPDPQFTGKRRMNGGRKHHA